MNIIGGRGIMVSDCNGSVLIQTMPSELVEPAIGTVRFNDQTNILEYYTGATKWQQCDLLGMMQPRTEKVCPHTGGIDVDPITFQPSCMDCGAPYIPSGKIIDLFNELNVQQNTNNADYDRAMKGIK